MNTHTVKSLLNGALILILSLNAPFAPTPVLAVAAPAAAPSPAPLPNATLEPLYPEVVDDFSDPALWNSPFQADAAFAAGGSVTLTLREAMTWGKLERTPQALVSVDLYAAPILRIDVAELSSNARWKLIVFKTAPSWQEFELQSTTHSVGTYDYDVPRLTGWNGWQKLQIMLVVEGAGGDWARFASLQIGSRQPPTPAPEPAPQLFVQALADPQDGLANTYAFSASGFRVISDDRREPYDWTTYAWDFGDGATASGPAVTHTYPDAQPYQATLTVSDDGGNVRYAFKQVGVTRSLYADYFVGYHSREASGRSDLWWWYATEKAPWSARAGDLYVDDSLIRKETIAYLSPLIGTYDQWDPAAIEYAILLSKLVGLDGFAFEYQDNVQSPAADLMTRFLPFAQQYDFKMTAQWIPATMYDWNKDEVSSRSEMLAMGQDVIQHVLQDFALPSGATYRLDGADRPVWFLFNWDRNQSLPDEDLPYSQTYNFGYTRDEITQLRTSAQQNLGVNPLFLAAAWSYWPEKWDAASGEPFPLAGVVDGIYGWMKPDFQLLPADDPYYDTHDRLGPGIDYVGSVADNLRYFDLEYAETQRQLSAGGFSVGSGTAFPGFDDAYNGAWGIGRRRYVPTQDANGYTLDQTLNRWAANATQIGLFATFADWAEGSTLEPTVEEGYAVAARAARGIASWKGQPVPSDDFLNTTLPLVERIYDLRHDRERLLKAGFSADDLRGLDQAIDAVVPALLAHDPALAQSRLDQAAGLVQGLTSQLTVQALTLEWVDEAQGATPTAGSLPLTHHQTGSQQAFTLPPQVRTLLNAGTYTGTLTFDYQDNSQAFLTASVNSQAGFASQGQATEILKVRKEGTANWIRARADFVNADFSPRFSDRADLTFQLQGALAYVSDFTHTANALSVAYWVKPDTLDAGIQNQLLLLDPTGGAETFASRANNAADGQATPGLLELYVNLGTNTLTVRVPHAFVAGQWTHVAATWDGAVGQLTVYVNGVVAGSAVGTGHLVDTTHQVLIGTTTNGLAGALDELHLYARPLAATEITALVAGEGPADAQGQWRFDEGTGSVAHDSAPGNHPAYLDNGAAWVAGPVLAGNAAALKLHDDSGGAAVRRVRLDLQVLQKIALPDLDVVFHEDFSDLDAWSVTDLATTANGDSVSATVTTAAQWGKLERTETGYFKIDLDRNPILRVDVRAATAMWKLVLFDAQTWQSTTIKYLGTQTGVIDLDLKKITGWEGGPKTYLLQIIIDGGADGAGRSVEFDTLQIGHYNALPAPTYGWIEDFADTVDWVTTQATFSAVGPAADLTVAPGQSTGSAELRAPATVDLERHGLLSIDVPRATGAWRLSVTDDATGRTTLVQPPTNATGAFSYDLASATGLSGTRSLQIRIGVDGAGQAVRLNALRFGQPTRPASWKVGFTADLTNASDWHSADLVAMPAGTNAVTLTLAAGHTWGQVTRTEFGRLIWVDLDRYPILRLTVPHATGIWKLMVYNAATWEEKLIKPMSDQTGVLDFNLKELTHWSGREVPLQVALILDSVMGTYVDASLLWTGLEFREDGAPLPAGVFIREDFSDVGDWTTDGVALNAMDGVATATTTASFGKLFRNTPGGLFNVNLDEYPILRLKVPQVDGLWKILIYNVSQNWEERTLKYLTAETGELDFNIKSLTGWSGKNVTLQLVIVVDNGVGRSLQLDTLEFRRSGHALPADVGFSEDFAAVNDWQTEHDLTLTTDGGAPDLATLTVPGSGWGLISRASPGALVSVDLDRDPILALRVAGASAGTRWQIDLADTATNEVKNVISNSVPTPGIRYVNVPALTGWHGVKTLQIKIAVADYNGGTGTEWLTLDELAFKQEAGSVLELAIPVAARQQVDYGGAASLEMALDYQGFNIYTQDLIFETARAANSLANQGRRVLDPLGMATALNHFEFDPVYNYAVLSYTSQAQAVHAIAYWLAYRVPGANPENLPAIVPLDGSYANWVVVNGYRASDDPRVVSSYTVNGFWIVDPNVEGIGQSVYLQASAFGARYQALNTGDDWQNRFVSVSEPPPTSAQVTLAAPARSSRPMTTGHSIVLAAREALVANGLAGDGDFGDAYADSQPGQPLLVQNIGGAYVIVPFLKDGGCSVAVILDARTGAFLQASYNDKADPNYLSRFASVRNQSTMAEAMRSAPSGAPTISGNAFLPEPRRVTMIKP